MATYPNTVSSLDYYPGRNPIHRYGTSVYTVSNATHIRKATDGGNSWDIQDSANRPNATIAQLSSISYGQYIHIVTQSTAELVEYHRFDMATDTWDSTNNTVVDLGGMSAPNPTYRHVDITYRADNGSNNIVISCPQAPSADMGDNYQKIAAYLLNPTGTPSITGPVTPTQVSNQDVGFAGMAANPDNASDAVGLRIVLDQFTVDGPIDNIYSHRFYYNSDAWQNGAGTIGTFDLSTTHHKTWTRYDNHDRGTSTNGFAWVRIDLASPHNILAGSTLVTGGTVWNTDANAGSNPENGEPPDVAVDPNTNDIYVFFFAGIGSTQINYIKKL